MDDVEKPWSKVTGWPRQVDSRPVIDDLKGTRLILPAKRDGSGKRSDEAVTETSAGTHHEQSMRDAGVTIRASNRNESEAIVSVFVMN
jgi:hypothetical protein